MKKFLRLNLIAIFILSTIVFVGCKNDYSIYLFTSQGGGIVVNDSQSIIKTKDIMYKNGTCQLKLEAKADEGYEFEHWLIDSKIYSTDPIITVEIKDETVIKSIFKQITESPSLPVNPDEPDNPENPDNPSEPNNPDEPSDSDYELTFVTSYFDSNQSSAIAVSPDCNYSVKDNKYYCAVDTQFKFKVETNFTNEYASNSKMCVKIAIKDTQSYVLLSQDDNGYYIVDSSTDARTIFIEQAFVTTISIDYGTIDEQLVEIYFDADQVFQYDFNSNLAYQEIQLDVNLLYHYMLNSIIIPINKMINDNDYTFRIYQIVVEENSNTTIFSLSYTDNTITISLASGEITNSLFNNNFTLYWKNYENI